MSDLDAVIRDLCSRRKKPTRILAGAAIYDAVYEQVKKAEGLTGKWMRWSDPKHPASLMLMGLPVVLCETMEPDTWLMDPTA